MSEHVTVVHGASEVVVGPGDAETLDVRSGAALAAVDGAVAAVGSDDEIRRAYPPDSADVAVDADGGAVVPGFVDPHTHAVFAGDRADEFAAKLRGRSYQEIAAGGGGIRRTVRAVRDASDDALLATLLGHLDAMLAAGSTTVEVKSGYGLDTETELRLLRAIERADERHPIDVVPTFLGAHAVPEGRDADDYVAEVVDDQLPAVADQGVAEFCDVFCDEGAFTADQSRRVLEAGSDHGLAPKIHADEFAAIGGVDVAADAGAASADHLLRTDAAGAERLTEAGVTPVLLPGTALALDAPYADPHRFQDAPVALATDFNPNCFVREMGFVLTLACTGMRMTPGQALLGATRNAALAVDRPDGPGTLQPGAPVDLVVLDAPSHVHLPYRFDETPVRAVLKAGHRVVADGEVLRGD